MDEKNQNFAKINMRKKYEQKMFVNLVFFRIN